MKDGNKEPRSLIASGLLYLLVGGGTALLELLLFTMFVYLLNLNLIVSNVLATIIVTVTNFLLNKDLSFRSTQRFWFSAVLYALLFVFNLFFSSIAIRCLVDVGVLPTVAKMLAMICIVTWDFILYRKVIFRNG